MQKKSAKAKKTPAPKAKKNDCAKNKTTRKKDYKKLSSAERQTGCANTAAAARRRATHFIHQRKITERTGCMQAVGYQPAHFV